MRANPSITQRIDPSMYCINRLQKELGSKRTSKANATQNATQTDRAQYTQDHARHDSGSGDSDDSRGAAVAAARLPSFPLQMPMGRCSAVSTCGREGG